MFSPNLLHLWPLLPGLLLPTISGWMILRLLEWKTPVLAQGERWTLGLLLGLTMTMYLTFLIHILGWISLTRWGFLGVQLIVAVLLSALRYGLQVTGKTTCNFQRANVPKWIKIVFILLGIWTAIKVLATGITFSLFTPLFFDDAIDNWNMRGKTFFIDQKLVLVLPGQSQETFASGVSSYPPTVPLVKAYLASILGSWDENLINSVHFMWYLLILTLIFLFLKRLLSPIWGALGVYIIVSLPLYLVHGTNPYADVFLSGHIFAAAMLLFLSAHEEDAEKKRSFLRLAILGVALLPFTKNEGLLLYFPPLVLFTIILILKNRKHFYSICTLFSCCTLSVLLPWLLFKWSHHLQFGNAKSINAFTEFSWQSEALIAIFLNTFFLGNWLLFFFLCFGLLIWQWRSTFSSPLLVLTGFFLIVYFGQLGLYLFTGLSAEAVKQTGYARGIVHLVPVMVMITVLLLEKTVLSVTKKNQEVSLIQDAHEGSCAGR